MDKLDFPVTLTDALAKPLDLHLYCRYFTAPEKECEARCPRIIEAPPTLKQGLAFRIGQLFRIPVECIAGAVDLGEGVLVGLINALTLRKFTCLNTIAQKSLGGADRMLSNGFFAALRAINPEAEVGDGFEGGGFTVILREFMREKTHACLNSDKWFTKHVASRLIQLGGGVLSLVTRIVDFVIGIIAAVVAFAKKGKSPGCNTVAFQGLKITAMISDVVKMITGILNPKENVNSDVTKCLAERDTNRPPLSCWREASDDSMDPIVVEYARYVRRAEDALQEVVTTPL